MILPHSRQTVLYSNYIFGFIIIMSALLLTTVLCMAGREDKGKAMVKEGEEGKVDEEFQEFVFQGSVEPKIVRPRQAENLIRRYQIFVSVKTVGEHPRHSFMSTPTDHKFLIPLRFNRKELLKKKGVIVELKKAAKIIPGFSNKNHPPSGTGIEQIEVKVKAKTSNFADIIRTWVFVDPDFLLHYQLNVGVLEASDQYWSEGGGYWLKGKIVLLPSIQLQPEDKISLVYVRREPAFYYQDDHTLSRRNDEHCIGTYSFGELTETGGVEVLLNDNILRFALKLDNAQVLLTKLTNPSERKSILKLSFEHDKLFGKSCSTKNMSEKQAAALLKKNKKKKKSGIKFLKGRMSKLFETSNKEKKAKLLKEKSPDGNRAAHISTFSGSAATINMAEQSEVKEEEGDSIAEQSDEQVELEEEDVCSICLEEIEEGEREWRCRKCGKYFHVHCILEWKKRKAKCPICNEEILSSEKDAQQTFMLLFEDPVLSADEELHSHYSFEYQYSMVSSYDDAEASSSNSIVEVENAQQELLKEMDNEEQMEFLETQRKWMPAKRELCKFLERTTIFHEEMPYWIQHAVSLAESRLKTVKITRLAKTNDDEKGKGKEVEKN